MYSDMKLYLIVKDIITLILAIVGLFITGGGLITWKKQIKGKKGFETAYDLHCAVLQLRHAFEHVRNPAIWPSESRTAIIYAKEKYPEKSDEEIEKDSHSYVYEMRWDKVQEARLKIDSYLLAAEVMWGSKILDLTKPLNKKAGELNIALKQHFQTELVIEDYMNINDIIYGRLDSDDKDNFSKEVNSIIDNISDYLKVKIK